MKSVLTDKIELIQKRLIHFEDLAPDASKFENDSQEEAEKKGFFSRDFGMEQWDWPQGVGIYGLSIGSENYNDYIIQWAKREIEKGLPTKNVNTMCPMLTLSDFPEFESLTIEWMEWIEESFPRTDERGLQHITSGVDKFTVKENHQQIWADTLFMTILFMAKMGVKYQNKQWIESSAYQVLTHIKYLLDRETGLFYHGWNFEDKSNYGANFWCRGNSWLTIGLPLYLKIVGDAIPEFVRAYIQQSYENQVKSLIELRGDDYLWHTLLDDKTSYTETSGSAGIIAGILLGINTHLLSVTVSDDFLEESIEAILSRVDETGVVHGVSAGTAISSEKVDYKGILQTPMVYGQSMVLLALEAYMTYLTKVKEND